MVSRRHILQGAGSVTALNAIGLPGLSLAAPATPNRLVVVILRGGMDGLAAVPAYGDPHYASARGPLAIPPPGADNGALALDGFFGLNPKLSAVAKMYTAGQVLPVHATCVPYHGRSHFEAQNVLENGSAIPYGLKTGWLNRALMGLPTRSDVGIALTQAMPVLMRGDASVTSWYPSVLPQPRADTLRRLEALYENDAKLAQALARARQANAMSGRDQGGGGRFPRLMRAAGDFLATDDGPRVAMIESTGWDTHASQNLPLGALQRNLSELDRGIGEFKNAVGPAWSSTVVLVMTEFGRTVAANGTLGSDHGTGGAAFILGGAVNGGRVLADWPGLQVPALYEERDLRPTTDLRAVMKGLLISHLDVDAAFIEREVFPDSRSVTPLDGLTVTS